MSPSASPRSEPSVLSVGARLRKSAAAVAAAGFLGASIAAPLSLSGAFAHDGGVAAQAQAQRTAQGFATEAGVEPSIDLGVSDAVQTSLSMAPGGAQFTLSDFLFRGVINWGGYKFTFYSQQVLPGGGLDIPGRHVNEGGFVSDAEGYIVLAGSAPKGTVYETPFGHKGKIYDRGTVGNHLDVYIR